MLTISTGSCSQSLRIKSVALQWPTVATGLVVSLSSILAHCCPPLEPSSSYCNISQLLPWPSRLLFQLPQGSSLWSLLKVTFTGADRLLQSTQLNEHDTTIILSPHFCFLFPHSTQRPLACMFLLICLVSFLSH